MLYTNALAAKANGIETEIPAIVFGAICAKCSKKQQDAFLKNINRYIDEPHQAKTWLQRRRKNRFERAFIVQTASGPPCANNLSAQVGNFAFEYAQGGARVVVTTCAVLDPQSHAAQAVVEGAFAGCTDGLNSGKLIGHRMFWLDYVVVSFSMTRR